MKLSRLSARATLAAASAALIIFGGLAGYGVARLTDKPAKTGQETSQAERPILYWYDPMLPMERYPGPGKSSMGMDLIPKYAEEPGPQQGVRIDPSRTENLGVRTVEAKLGQLPASVTATGAIDYNQRDIAIVQARANGFVQRVYARAPGDVVRAGAPLVDLLIPEWRGAQAEFLSVKRTGDRALVGAARQRLALLGMPETVIAAVERSGRPQAVQTITTPIGGVIRTLGVRAGMTVSAGQNLAEVSGLSTVWLNAAVPEALAGQVRIGQPATASLVAFPGQTFVGRVSAILPEAEGSSRTLTARIELPNNGGLLRPGMFATVQMGGVHRPALLIPTEAVIRTGRRTLVMLALADARFQPAEIRIGREAGGMTEVLAGLSDGERVVASGQFLIDSEASLSGAAARPVGGPQ